MEVSLGRGRKNSLVPGLVPLGSALAQVAHNPLFLREIPLVTALVPLGSYLVLDPVIHKNEGFA